MARRQYESRAVPPFTLFFHPHDPLVHLNYAIPDIPVEDGDLAGNGVLDTLREAFAGRRRVPRFEFVEAFAPFLSKVLSEAGFVEEARTYLMVVTRESARRPAPVTGLDIELVTASSDPATIRLLLRLQRLGFGLSPSDEPSDEDVLWYTRLLLTGTAFLARLDGEPAGVGVLMPEANGIAEVGGVATLAEKRRRGVGAAVTSAAVLRALENGVSTVVLSAGDERAGRVYRAVGFEEAGYVLMYREPGPDGDAGGDGSPTA